MSESTEIYAEALALQLASAGISQFYRHKIKYFFDKPSSSKRNFRDSATKPFNSASDSDKCLWFDENGYWRQGSCENVGTSANSLRISRRDLDCPYTKITEYENEEDFSSEQITLTL